LAFPGVDYLDVDSLLSEDQRMVRDTVRGWVDEKVLPIIEDAAWEGRFPKELVPEMAQMQLFGATISEYGLPGLDNISYGLIMQELERGDSGLRSFVSVQSALVMYPIFAFGSKEQKDKWIPRLAKAEAIGCFGLTEPDFGSNPAGMRTSVRKEGDSYVVNGAKAWITNGSIADIAIVWAKAEADEIRGFIVEKDRKGYAARETHHKLSLRASVTSELMFQDCLIPEENVLPGSKGLKSPLMCLTQARYGISWGATGAAMSCFDTAVKYSKERVQFGRPIGGFQLTQKKLAEMATEITKAQLLSLQLGRMKDAGRMKPVHVSMAKMNNVAMALECARTARGILGANGITGDYPIMRHMANLESVYTYEGTNEVHTLVLGQHFTGISAFE
jgi:glutaryl-CoA dehydrogenase